MTIVGNIALFIATIVTFILIASVFGKAPTQSGDAAAGYPMGVILFNLIFLVCMVIAALAIATKGGFDWVSSDKTVRYFLVFSGLFLAVISAALSALFKYEGGSVPVLLRIFSGFAPAIIPLILVFSGIILLNNGIRESMPIAVYKWPLAIAAVLGVLGTGAGMAGWIAEGNKNAARQTARKIEVQERYKQGFLAEIDSCDVQHNLVRILVFTDKNHENDVRTRAVNKIKTNPEWQQELTRLLENEGSLEVFNFLNSNDVDNKQMFAQPVNTGIHSLAEYIRREIRKASHPAHLHESLFEYDVIRMLGTADKFDGLGMDYLPAVKNVRAALDEPASVQKPSFHCATLLDAWIQKHEKQ